MMHYNNFGATSLQVSCIGLGCMSLNPFNGPEAVKIINTAINAGINYFDTADIYQYGANETLLGKALAGKRQQVIVATKVGNVWNADKTALLWQPSKSYILNQVNESLKRLNTDYIDVYQLHGGTIDDPSDEIIEALELLKLQGKIRYYGISSIRPNVIKSYVEKSGIESVMMQYGLLDRRPETGCLPLLHENKKSVMARGVLAKGLLAGKPSAAFLGFSPGEVHKIVTQLHQVANNRHTIEALSIQFVLKHPAVSSAVVGVSSLQQLQVLLAAQPGAPVNDTIYAFMQQIAPAAVYTEHL